MNDRRKQSLYLDGDIWREMKAESVRQQRSLSWLVQHAWRLARPEVKKFRHVEFTPQGRR